MKKKLAVICCIAFACATCLCVVGCGSSSEQSSTANPVHESTQQGVIDATGIDLPAPDSSVDPAWSYIEGDSDPIAQLTFTFESSNVAERAQNTALLELPSDYTLDAGSTGKVSDADISGLYYKWTGEASGTVQNRDAQVFTNDEGALVIWLDPVVGITYNLYIAEGGLSTERILQIAELTFSPMQGES